MAPRKPSFKELWEAFPTHDDYPTMKDLFTRLGGQAEKNIHKGGFGPNGNTCASRLSVAFNGGGAPIDAKAADGAQVTWPPAIAQPSSTASMVSASTCVSFGGSP